MQTLLRAIGASLAAVLLLGPLAGDAQNLQKVRVIQSSAEALVFAPSAIAVAKGFFTQDGLDVDLSAMLGDGQAMQTMAGGTADIALASGPALAYIAKGIPMKAVAALANDPSGVMLFVSKASHINRLADLKGKRIGISSAGSMTDWLTRQIASSQGWPPDAITEVAVGDIRGMTAALKTGSIDGFVHATENGYFQESEGYGHVLVNFGTIVRPFHSNIIYAQNDLIEHHPDVLRKFLHAWFKTIAWMHANQAEAIRIQANKQNFTEAVMARAFRDQLPTWSTDGVFNDAALQRLSASFVDLKILDTAPDVNKLVDRRFTPVKL